MYWRPPTHKLSALQRVALDNAENYEGKIFWLRGFAGSGKTVLVLELLERFLRLHPYANVAFISFTYALRDLVSTGVSPEYSNRIKVFLLNEFIKQEDIYDLVAVDEIQDVTLDQLSKINQKARRIYLSGDFDQKIYDKDLREDALLSFFYSGVEDLPEVYRLTTKIINIAKVAYPRSRIEQSSSKAPIKQGADVYAIEAENDEEEVRLVWEKAVYNSGINFPSLILLPKHKDIQKFLTTLTSLGVFSLTVPVSKEHYEEINRQLESQDIPLRYFGNGFGDLTEADNKPMVYLMTYHSSKGLDFPSVFLPFLNDSMEIAWPKIRENIPDIDSKLLYVALTRSNYNLYISYSGSPHPFLAKALEQSLIIRANLSSEEEPEEDDDDDDLF